ncbi:MAG: hypothetical protein AUG49_04350 [Catenulispora sp. 13_1_20CM_3_70_7]|nr:MAG: hypothetical protein AUG49_04350 [Catenulispora sp. 13_1_20CM_3_70_7]
MNRDRPRVCLLQVPPFAAGRTGTGAQVVAAEIASALAESADVTLLHGYTDDSPRAVHRDATGVLTVPAFRITAQTLRGTIAPHLTPVAREALDAAHLLVTMECTLSGGPAVPRVVCLGGFGYAHTFELLDGGGWDRLVVPSRHLADMLRRRVAEPDSVQVIENGIDPDAFAPSRPARTPAPPPGQPVRLLLPGRPDAIKGGAAVLDLARALAADGTPTTVYRMGGRRSPVAGRPDGHPGVTVADLPWRDRAAMPELYRQADLTICFSGIPEGFNLAAVESIACGTPVLAWPAGALGTLLPPGHGIVLTDRDAGPQAWAAAARDALAGAWRDCREGRRYIRDRYDVSLMASRYRALVAQLLSAA